MYIYKKKLNLLKQFIYEEIPTIVFLIRGLVVESLLFTEHYSQKASERKGI